MIALALLLLLGLLAASGYSLRSDFAATASSTNSPIVAQPSKPNGTPAPLKLLKVEPVKGYVGDIFTVTGDGFTPGKKVDFFWATADGAYVTKVMSDNVEYHERKYEEKRVRLGSTAADPQGRVKVGLYRAGGFRRSARSLRCDRRTDVGRGGFRILRSATITPAEGPVGTPITVTVKGLSWRGFEQFMALRYDNKYTGEISGSDD